ncbi:hypothetical protein [Fusobacterium necrophorum]|uniref:hypothetical protein n=1 Tax=Fusobacterium necrophorum TaxID=859 RepID=UPI00241FC7DB|nr:hypothetical protein [Fusobacterium necrophorum]MDK4523179.1 hypothetical protein [Fusobacterium necrophorum]
MYKIQNQSFEELINSISSAIGISIDSSSFDYDILKAFYEYNKLCNSKIEEKLNSLLYENMSGTDLDDFLSFYNIYRIQGNNDDLYEVELLFSSENSLLLEKDCLLEIDGRIYQTVSNFQIGNSVEKISLQRSNERTIEHQLISKDFKIIIDADKAKISSDKNIFEEIQKLYLISIRRIPNEVETDFEFLSRAKSILQNFGYSNKEKIKNQLLQDKRIKNVHIEDSNGVSYITIYPYDTNKLDEIIINAKHIVNYFKDSNIQLLKPNIVEVNVFGLKEQIDFLANKEEIMNSVIQNLKLVLNTSYMENEEVKIKKEILLNSVKETLSTFSNLEIKKELLGINYNYYFRENYRTPIYNKDVDEVLIIHSYDVVTEGSVL